MQTLFIIVGGIVLIVVCGLTAGVGAWMQTNPQVPPTFWSDIGTILKCLIPTGVVGTVIWFAISQPLGHLSKAMSYEHRQVELNENDSIIGYRYLAKATDGSLRSMGMGLLQGHNPITGYDSGKYVDGWNVSNKVPTAKNNSGIYAAKTPDSPVLDDYREPGTVLVKVELSGRVVEGEYGYRAQFCRVLEVIDEVPNNRKVYYD